MRMFKLLRKSKKRLEKIPKKPRQDTDEAQADSELEELKPKDGSIFNSTASQSMPTLCFSVVRRGHSPNSVVQETHDLLGISRNRVMTVSRIFCLAFCFTGRVSCRDCSICAPLFSRYTALSALPDVLL